MQRTDSRPVKSTRAATDARQALEMGDAGERLDVGRRRDQRVALAHHVAAVELAGGAAAGCAAAGRVTAGRLSDAAGFGGRGAASSARCCPTGWTRAADADEPAEGGDR